MQQTRIYLLADSLALPRPSLNGSRELACEDTYPYRLRSKLESLQNEKIAGIDFICNALRFRTMPEAASFWWEVELFRPTMVIVHIGIVDCAPRVFSRGQHWFVNGIRPIRLRNSILAFVERHRRSLISISPGKVYTSPANFESSASSIAQRSSEANVKLCFVSIAPTDERLSFRSPGIQENIRKYNEILRKVANEWHASYVDLHSAVCTTKEEFLLADGHHLGLGGHILLADLISKWIRSSLTGSHLEESSDPEDNKQFGL